MKSSGKMGKYLRQGAPADADKKETMAADRPPRGGRLASRPMRVLFCGLFLMLLSACATTGKDKSFANEKLLVSAGFNFKEAQTPDQLAKLQKLPQKTLLRKEIKGKPVYLYAVADGCRCLYAGDEAAYNRFRTLRQEARLDAKQQEGILAEDNLAGLDEDWTAYVDDLDSGMLPDGI